jgi:hypothetical protein
MAEHLHGYPRCETPAGQACPETDVNYVECHAHGALQSCQPSVVDGIPTGQYHCVHRDAMAAAAPKRKPAAKAKAKAKPRKAAKKPAKKKPAKKARKAGKKAKKAAKKAKQKKKK